MEKILFETKTTYTYDEYRRFSWKMALNPVMIISLIVMEAVFVGMALYAADNALMMVAVLFAPVYLFLMDRQIKKTYTTNTQFAGATTIFRFYEDAVVATDNDTESRVSYDELFKVIETGRNFYLLVTKNQGFVLIKDNMPEGLDEFLRNLKPKK